MADDVTLAAMAKAIADIESGGHADPYAAIGPASDSGDRPYGKYQVMGNNVPEWTNDVGLGRMSPRQFLSSPDAQEKVFHARMGKYLDDYSGSVKDAASLWHAGVPYERAVAEGRKDIVGTQTRDYADHIAKAVGGFENDPSSPTGGPSAKTVLGDPKFWQLSADDRMGVMKKVDPKFAGLAPSDQTAVLQRFQPADFQEPVAATPTETPTAPTPPPTGPVDTLLRGASDQLEGHEKDLDTAARSTNRGLGLPEDNWLGQYTVRIGMNATNALKDFFDGISGMTHPAGIKDALGNVLKILHPLAVPGESATDLVWKAANDSGFAANYPAAAAALSVATGLGVGAAVPIPGIGKGAELPLQGSKSLREAASAASAEAALARSAGPTAAEAEAAATAATRAESAAAKAIEPSADVAARAEAALTPEGTTVPAAGTAAKGALTKRLADLREQTGAVYDSAVANAEASGRTLDFEQYPVLTTHLRDVRAKLGTLPDAAEKAVSALEKKVKDAAPITAGDLNAYKAAVDTTFPGKMKTGTVVRNMLRSLFDTTDRPLAEAADVLWRDEIAGKGMTTTSLGSIVRAIKKTDPAAVVEKLFGTGKTDAQGAMMNAVVRHLGADSAEVNGLREAVFSRMLKPDADGNVDPTALVKAYDALNPRFRSAVSTPGVEAFFKAEREAQSALGQRAATAATTAKDTAKAAKASAAAADSATQRATAAEAAATAPNKMATLMARGLKIAGAGITEAVASKLHMPGVGGAAGLLELMIPTADIAKFLANSKTANLIARMMRTPANSAVVPTLLQQLHDSELGQQLLASPEGQQKLDEARGVIAARQSGGPVTAGQPYLVGEAGPEVVVPNTSGTVVPNANAATPPNSPPRADEFRSDGSRKGPGWLGSLRFHDGRTSTELSIGVNLDGKEVEIPSLVPTLTQHEIDFLLAGNKPSEAIVNKAVAHARKQLAQGRSPFKEGVFSEPYQVKSNAP